jgi:hypothetical protein
MITDPAAVANKWATRLSGATQAITDGVNAVTQAPGAKAAAQADVWLAKLQASRDKWVRNVSAVTLQQWQTAMTTKGVQRIATGAQAAVPKMTAFMSQWLPYEAAGVQSLASQPRGTIDQNIQRAITMMRYNAQFVRKPYTGI